MGTRSHPIRVLVRPPPSPAPSPSLPPQTPPPPDPHLTPQNGVVVVGFVGRRHHDVAHLINKIIDSNVFGSGNSDIPFRLEPDKINAEMAKWFESRKLSFYHEEEQGILYLQYSSVCCPVTGEGSFGDESLFEDQELGDLQGFLFMFSVCHVIILIQEGSRFDTHMLKKFRILQAAKHTMAPFVKSQNPSPITSRPHSSAQARRASHNNPSPGKSLGILNRNTSAITGMSGLGSYTSLLPGQCTPVILFVFLDDFPEIHGNMEESSDSSSLKYSSSLKGSVRPSAPVKGSGPVLVLARPVNKSEGGVRKKLQSSLESQIRFSIKKCRTLSGLESSHGSRTGGIPSSASLFFLDASKAVSLVDACSSESGESLEFAIGLVEELLEGKGTPDSLLLESHYQNSNKEDILSVKEFIYKQSDLLRGRGGSVSNNNSSSAAGVGMFAAAAAAAAASTSATSSTAAFGKTIAAPDLPSLEMWSSSSQIILHGILSAKLACLREQDPFSQPGDNLATSFVPVVSQLESGVGLNSRFSTLRCEKAFPFAKEVYLDNLPPCYPSSQHEVHLKKALTALSSMVKGPALQRYMNKLRDECTSIWSSGRQLCDAVSLTGNPCMHQRHDEIKPHLSGFVYLHACACGRSRRLRPDPFDYDTANIEFNTFSDCDKLLPAVCLSEGRIKGPVLPSSWNLIRVGGAKYYDPSKGLLQSGFCVTQKFLLKWTILLEKLKEENCQLPNDSQQVCLDRDVVDANSRISQNGLGSDTTRESGKPVIFGRGLSKFTMKKAFSEVVAGPAAASSAFPPLSSRKQPLSDADKGFNHQHTGQEKPGEAFNNNLEFQKIESIASVDKLLNDNSDHFPHIGNNVVALGMNNNKHIEVSSSIKNVTIYVGFEHECPRGHRFILNQDHLNELGSSYSVPEENANSFSVENSDRKQNSAKLGKIGGHSRNKQHPNGIVIAGGSGKSRNFDKSKEKIANGSMFMDKSMQSARQGKHQNDRTKVSGFVKDQDFDLKPTSIDGGGQAFSLLNRNLPIYMNCPHCRDSTLKNDSSNVKFASSTSQLQRIFVVTPSFPIVLASDPVIQFESSCLPPSITDREQKLQFRLGCPVILPPESFVSLRLPFVYGVEMEDGSLHSLKPFENLPQLTAYIVKGTTLRVVSNRNHFDLAVVT